jgi:hypothetical protein
VRTDPLPGIARDELDDAATTIDALRKMSKLCG